jgi:hypothetical protein
MSKSEFGASVGVAKGLIEVEKLRIDALQIQVGSTNVVALQDQVQQHQAEINALQQQAPGGSEGNTTFYIKSATVADLTLTNGGVDITSTLTNAFQNIFSATTSTIITNNAHIPSGQWATNIDITSNQQKDFDAKLEVFRVVGAVDTLLCTLIQNIPAGASTVALNGQFEQFVFDSGDKLKFVLSLKSNHGQTITITPNKTGQNKDCHIHTPVLISTSYTRAQADSLLANKVNAGTISPTTFNTRNVSKQGSDTTGSGSIDKPFATIIKSLESLKNTAGDGGASSAKVFVHGIVEKSDALPFVMNGDNQTVCSTLPTAPGASDCWLDVVSNAVYDTSTTPATLTSSHDRLTLDSVAVKTSLNIDGLKTGHKFNRVVFDSAANVYIKNIANSGFIIFDNVNFAKVPITLPDLTVGNTATITITNSLNLNINLGRGWSVLGDNCTGKITGTSGLVAFKNSPAITIAIAGSAANLSNQTTSTIITQMPANTITPSFYTVGFTPNSTEFIELSGSGTFVEKGDLIYVVAIINAVASCIVIEKFSNTTIRVINNNPWIKDIQNSSFTPAKQSLVLLGSESAKLSLSYGVSIFKDQIIAYPSGLGYEMQVLTNTDPSKPANWSKITSNGQISFKPKAFVTLVLGQSNADSYAGSNAFGVKLSSAMQYPSRGLTGGSAENTNIFNTVAVTANNTKVVTITNSNWISTIQIGTRVYGTSVPDGSYVDAISDDYTQITFNNAIPNTVTSMSFSQAEGKIISVGSNGYNALIGYRVSNSAGQGIGSHFVSDLRQLIAGNTNDVVVAIPVYNGSTGFSGGHWTASTGYLALETVKKYKEAKAKLEMAGYDVVFEIMLWVNGEEDARQNYGTTAYQNALVALITYLKTNCLNSNSTPSLPAILLMGLHSWWRDNNLGYNRGETISTANKVAIDNALRNVPALVEASIYVPNSTTNLDYNSYSDCIHLNSICGSRAAQIAQQYLVRARQNSSLYPSSTPTNVVVNGNQTIGALVTVDARFQQKLDIETKLTGEVWGSNNVQKYYDIEGGSTIVAADHATTIDVRVRSKKNDGSGVSDWVYVNNTTINSSILNQMQANFTATLGEASTVYSLSTFKDGILNSANEVPGPTTISRWNNKVAGKRHAENCIMGTNYPAPTTINLTAGSNQATVASATGIVANVCYVDIVSDVQTSTEINDFSVLPRLTKVTSINATTITLSTPALITGNYNVRFRYDNTVNAGGASRAQVGGKNFGNPYLSYIRTYKGGVASWIKALHTSTENEALIVDGAVPGNASYTITVAGVFESYANLQTKAGVALMPNFNAGFGSTVRIDGGSRNLFSRIYAENLGLLCTVWRASGAFVVTANHNSLGYGATDTKNLVAGQYFLINVSFNRTTGLLTLYRDGVSVATFTNTATLSAFMGSIGAIWLSNGQRAGSPGMNYLAAWSHQRELTASEITSVKTFLENQFSIKFGQTIAE